MGDLVPQGKAALQPQHLDDGVLLIRLVTQGGAPERALQRWVAGARDEGHARRQEHRDRASALPQRWVGLTDRRRDHPLQRGRNSPERGFTGLASHLSLRRTRGPDASDLLQERRPVQGYPARWRRAACTAWALGVLMTWR